MLSRLSTDGKVAHEEGIGEFALVDNQKNGRPNDPTPTYDYKMIDSDYLLAPIAAAWLIDDTRGKARAAAYLAQRGGDGQTLGSRRSSTCCTSRRPRSRSRNSRRSRT